MAGATSKNNRFGRRAALLALVLTACLAGTGVAAPAESATTDTRVIKQLSIAETQHEIIQLLIQKGEYAKAVAELQVILDLNLPVPFEEAVFKEIVIVTRKLYDAGQKERAYEALELGFDALTVVEYRARVLNVKAGLLKRDGRIDEAIQTYKQEVELREKKATK
jgi:tetratricopeptide (TPR) repeat protein